MNEKYTDIQLEHFFQKWLYTYGGASDVQSLKDYIEEGDTHWGSIDVYDVNKCPCILCHDASIQYEYEEDYYNDIGGES